MPIKSPAITISPDNKASLLEADTDDLNSKIYEHEAAIHFLQAQILSKKGQFKRRKINH